VKAETSFLTNFTGWKARATLGRGYEARHQPGDAPS